MHARFGVFLSVATAAVLGVLETRTEASSGDSGKKPIQFNVLPMGFELGAGDRPLASSSGDPLVVLLYSESPTIWSARSWRMVGPDRPTVRREGRRFVISISSFGGLAVKAELTGELDDARSEIRWTAQLENRVKGTVVGLIGPCLRNIRDLPGGFLTIPNRPGHRIRNPWKTLERDVQHLEYPVPASMQYMAYSGTGGGIAVHVLDREMVYKQLAFGGPGRQMTFIQYPFVAPGEKWTSPEIVWQILSEDWHQAADRYRAWFRSWAEKPEVSPSVRKMPSVPGIVVLARPEEDAHLKDVQKSMEVGTYEAAGRKAREFARAGMDGVHLVGWFGEGHDSTYPDHQPVLRAGGEGGLLRLAKEMRAANLLAIYYLNARLLNLTSRRYQAHPDWAAIVQEGKPRREQIGREVFHVACPASPGYQEHLCGEVLRVAGRYGGDGAQLDQIGAAWSVLCFDSSHGHRTPATAWAEGHVRLLKRVRKAVRAVNPRFFAWIEGAWEGAGQFVDLSQGGFWPDHPGSEPLPEMYRYTLPEHPLFGDARIGGVPYWCPSDIGRAKRIDAAASSFFWDGEFRDTLGLQIDNGGEARWFKLDSRALVTVHNLADVERSFTLRLLGTDLDWKNRRPIAKSLAAETDLEASLDGKSVLVRVSVPARQVEAVLLTPGP